MIAPRTAITIGLVLAWLPGCGIVKFVPAKSGNEASSPPGDKEDEDKYSAKGTDKKMYPDAMALLAKSEDALAKGNGEHALDLAHQGREALDREYDGHKLKDVVVSESHERVRLRVWLFEGLALRKLGRDLDAALALHGTTFDVGNCKRDIKDRCEEHAEWLARTYPALVGSSSFVELHETGGQLTADLNTDLMAVYDRQVTAKRGFVGVFVEYTSKKPDKDGVTLRVDGTTSKDSYEDCNKVGEARIAGQKFDVERCHDHAFVSQRANFVVKVPADDAAQLKGEKGEQAFVVFDVKSWKRTGNTWNAGTARIAFVRPPGR